MDTETDRERPGPKRERHLDFIPQIEYCPECTRQIVWQKRISNGAAVDSMPYHLPPRAGTGRRFKRCCVCAAKLIARERRAAA
jgi:hypothetical protein